MQSDQGPEFVNEVISALMTHEGIHHRFVTAYHPEGNAKVEASNKTISAVLVKMMGGDVSFWNLCAPLCQLTYNVKVRETTGSTPFSLFLNRRMNPLIDYTGARIDPVTDDNWRAHQEEVISLVFPAIEE